MAANLPVPNSGEIIFQAVSVHPNLQGKTDELIQVVADEIFDRYLQTVIINSNLGGEKRC